MNAGSRVITDRTDSALSAASATELARQALADQTEADVVDRVAGAARTIGSDPRLWQWTGLLHRALDDRIAAMAAFDRASGLAPGDASIAHGLARVTYEAGRDAVALYQSANRLAPHDGDVLLGRAAARLAIGDGETATGELAAIVARAPAWIAGHEQLARLRWMLGERSDFTGSYGAAVTAAPRNPALWQSWLATLMHARAFDAAQRVIDDARTALGEQPFLAATQAMLWSDTGDPRADTAYDRLDSRDIPHVRHLVRTARIADAATLVEAGLKGPDANAFTPYAAIVWRLIDARRHAWLEEREGLVSVIDLAETLPPLDRLAATLRGLHRARDQHLDQSVRGGTQTDGILLANVDPDIQLARRAIVAAVEGHIARLPPADPRHPTLAMRRDRVPRFAGSWSVRLSGGGRHANHVHPQGWISSALYMSLPESQGTDAGWLTLGQPDDNLGLNLSPVRTIEPKAGRLVLFPSTMWHGTVPFATGERLTIAFDIAPPPA